MKDMTRHMIRPSLISPVEVSAALLIAMGLVACSASEPTESESRATVDEVASEPDVIMNDEVTISVDRLISEESACLLMMDVENGTEDDVSAGLFAFNVTGNGETAGANMFPQQAESGGTASAQIILMGASCDDALTIEGGQIACTLTETGETCTDKVVLADDEVIFADDAGQPTGDN